MEKIHFKEGDDVAFKDNLYQKMNVIEVVYRIIEVPDKPKADGSGFTKKKVNKLDGIICLWYDLKGNLHKEKFHSRVIVPWSIAEKGAEAVHKYLQPI